MISKILKRTRLPTISSTTSTARTSENSTERKRWSHILKSNLNNMGHARYSDKVNLSMWSKLGLSKSWFEGFPQQTGCPGMVPPPPTVLQWLLVWILHREIIAYISELRAQKRLVGLEFDGNSPSWVWNNMKYECLGPTFSYYDLLKKLFCTIWKNDRILSCWVKV